MFSLKQRMMVLSGAAVVCWTIWKTRNNAYFGHKFPDKPVGVLYYLSSLLMFGDVYKRDKMEETMRLGQN